MLNNLMVRDLKQQSVNKSKIEIIEVIENHIKEMRRDTSSYNKEVEELAADLQLFKNLVYNIDSSQMLANPSCNIVYVPRCYDNSCEFECTFNAQNESTCTYKTIDCGDCSDCADGSCSEDCSEGWDCGDCGDTGDGCLDCGDTGDGCLDCGDTGW